LSDLAGKAGGVCDEQREERAVRRESRGGREQREERAGRRESREKREQEIKRAESREKREKTHLAVEACGVGDDGGDHQPGAEELAVHII
jgi:sRNA-binding protein